MLHCVTDLKTPIEKLLLESALSYVLLIEKSNAFLLFSKFQRVFLIFSDVKFVFSFESIRERLFVTKCRGKNLMTLCLFVF